jgi:hypothetical protein
VPSDYEIVYPDKLPNVAPQLPNQPGSIDYDIVSPDGNVTSVPSSKDVLERAEAKLNGLHVLRQILAQAKRRRVLDEHNVKVFAQRRKKSKMAKASRKRNRK